MRRITLGLMSLSLVVAACGGADSDANAELPAFPPVVVNDWLVGVDAADPAAVADAVDTDSLTLLIAVENGYAPAQIATMLDDGIDPGLAAAYWQSFGGEFATFSGESLDALDVARYEILAVDDLAFAAVEVVGPEGRFEVLTRSDGADSWRVDMLATLGPAFAAQLRRLAEELPDGPAGDRVRVALQTSAVPALRAAATRDPGNRVLSTDVARLQELLVVVVVDTTVPADG